MNPYEINLPQSQTMTVRLTQEEVDFIDGFAADHELTRNNALRLLVFLAKSHADQLQSGYCLILQQKRARPQFAKKTTVKVMPEELEYINRFAEENHLSQQHTLRFFLYILRTELKQFIGNTNVFIVY